MSGLALPAGVYPIDKAHSQLSFAVSHLGLSTIRGTFDRFEGALTIGEVLGDTVVEIEADMGSINSGNTMRDDHVKNADWLDVEQFPTMTFRSTGFTGSKSKYGMTGDLTIKGVTLPLTLDVRHTGSNVFPVDKLMHQGFSARGEISRSAYGVSFGVPGVSDLVTLSIEAQFVSPKAE